MAESSNSRFCTYFVSFVFSKFFFKFFALQLQNQASYEALRDALKKFDQLYLSIKQDEEHHKTPKHLSEIDDKLEKLLVHYDLDDVIAAFNGVSVIPHN